MSASRVETKSYPSSAQMRVWITAANVAHRTLKNSHPRKDIEYNRIYLTCAAPEKIAFRKMSAADCHLPRHSFADSQLDCPFFLQARVFRKLMQAYFVLNGPVGALWHATHVVAAVFSVHCKKTSTKHGNTTKSKRSVTNARTETRYAAGDHRRGVSSFRRRAALASTELANGMVAI